MRAAAFLITIVIEPSTDVPDPLRHAPRSHGELENAVRQLDRRGHAGRTALPGLEHRDRRRPLLGVHGPVPAGRDPGQREGRHPEPTANLGLQRRQCALLPAPARSSPLPPLSCPLLPAPAARSPGLQAERLHARAQSEACRWRCARSSRRPRARMAGS